MKTGNRDLSGDSVRSEGFFFSVEQLGPGGSHILGYSSYLSVVNKELWYSYAVFTLNPGTFVQCLYWLKITKVNLSSITI